MEGTEFYADLGLVAVHPEYPQGWRITCMIDGEEWNWSADDRDVRFARKVDCELAIKALADAGITTVAQLDALPDSVWIPIAMSGLQW